LNSEKIQSANKQAVRNAVVEYAAELRTRHPASIRITWFGSWVSGIPVPSSDVDICIVLSTSDRTKRDRIPEYLPSAFPVDVDLSVYTVDEFEELSRISPQWFTAISSGKDV